MGKKKCEQIVHHIEYMDDRLTQEKMFNIISHWEMQNKIALMK